ncbi:DUF58 domain-containing protein [Ferrimonas pelagia]|uniref:DUF58 domain-containing protein n=1 Tax=Ferrimonas pelagia TaxID=1177826 RepID=UPI0031E80B02
MPRLVRSLYLRWLRRRLPAAPRQVLSHRNIFILPSKSGALFLGMTAVLFLLGTNYQNNLVLALAFLLFSLFNTSILMAFRNLAGLTLASGQAHHRHAGEPIPFDLSVSSARPLFQLHLKYEDGPLRRINRVLAQETQVQLLHPSERRGVLKPGRIRIESRYPLGLCRVWSHLDLAQSALVWPAAEPGPVLSQHSEQHVGSEPARSREGLDDFQGLARWQPGQSRARIAWKQWAQSGQLQVKQFVAPQGAPTHVTLHPGSPIELALSAVAAELTRLHHQGVPFALALGAQRFAPEHGSAHLKRCLDGLARYRSSD